MLQWYAVGKFTQILGEHFRPIAHRVTTGRPIIGQQSELDLFCAFRAFPPATIVSLFLFSKLTGRSNRCAAWGFLVLPFGEDIEPGLVRNHVFKEKHSCLCRSRTVIINKKNSYIANAIKRLFTDCAMQCNARRQKN